MPRNSEIPRFDLAEQILAEQRKITAIKRKAPSKKVEASSQGRQAQSIGYATQQPTLLLSEQQQTRLPRVSNEREDTSEGWYGGQVIAEIVARDIANLCYGKIKI